MRLAAGLAVLLLASPAAAGDYRAPLNTYGQPDLEGLWSNGYLTQMERDEDVFKALVPLPDEVTAFERARIGKPPAEDKEDKIGAFASEWWELNQGLARIRGQPRSSWIVSPADGKIPLNQAARDRRKARREIQKGPLTDPENRSLGERCIDPSSAGPPFVNGGYNDNYQIVQTRDSVAIFNEYDHNMRVVHLGGKHPAAGYRRWMGDSVGHYEGQTLVIETTNFTVIENEDPQADAKVVERITRISPTKLFYEFVVTEPALYEQPWRGEMLLFTIKGPIYEFACHEGNYALEHILAAGKAAADAAPRAEGAGP